MTLRMYADFKKLPVDKIAVSVHHEKRHSESASDAMENEPPLDHFTREIAITGDLNDEQRARILKIADRCPVHKTLERSSHIETREVPAT